ncbi:unnamed protein product [Rhodiola kirilowii]
MAFSANLGGWIADTLVIKGMSVTTVRKLQIMQSCKQSVFLALLFS